MSALGTCKSLGLGAGERDHGVLVTARLRGTDDQVLVSVPGKAKLGDTNECLRVACERIEGWDGDWCVESICTPRSVYRDLQGMRVQTRDAQAGDTSIAEFVASPWATELLMLGRIGKGHLLTDRCMTAVALRSRRS